MNARNVQVGDLVVCAQYPGEPLAVTRLTSGSWSGRPMVECSHRGDRGQPIIAMWYVDQIRIVRRPTSPLKASDE